MLPKEVANIKTIQVEAEFQRENRKKLSLSLSVPLTGLLHSFCTITYCPGLIFNVGETFLGFGRFIEAKSICLGDPS